jgi:hypothetical protein
MPSIRPLIHLSALLLLAGPVLAQGSSAARAVLDAPEFRTVRALRAPSPPALDGRLDEAVWDAAPVAADFVQSRPDPGAPASQPTEVRVLYDDDALYLGARLHDVHPDSVVAQLVRRDEEGYSDWFEVGIDGHHDRRTAFVFAVNPRGVKRDLRVDGEDGMDPGWDAVWDAAVRVDSLGWIAEIRIPLSQLRFSAEPGEAVWGINFARRIARRDELARWSPTPPDAAGIVSRYGELHGLDRLRPARRIEIQPYSVGRLTRAPVEPGDPFHTPTALDASLGLDLRYGLTSGLTLTATVNPDFGQVEADPSEVNLSAFESYYEEKRPFFTEGADLFGGWPRLFYSRRIGRAPQGGLPGEAEFSVRPEASTILGAMKLTGRTAGGWSLGLMEAVTTREVSRYVDASGRRGAVPVEPLTYYSVARVSRDFRGGGSSAGAMLTATNRRLEEGDGLDFLRSAAYTGSLDGRHRFGGGDFQATGALLGSFLLGSPRALERVQTMAGHYFQRPDAGHLRFDSTRTSLAGHAARVALEKIGGGHWRWGLRGHAYSPGFEINDLGFGSSADEVGGSFSVEYRQFRPGRLFRRWDLSSFFLAESTWGGEWTTAVLDVTGSAQLHNQWSAYGWIQRDFATLDTDALRGGPALVVPRQTSGYLSVRSDPRKPLSLRLGGYASAEDGTDGGSLRLSSTASLRASPRAELSLGPEVAWNRSPWQWVGRGEARGRGVYLSGHLQQVTTALTARLNYTFSPTVSLQLYAQPFLSAGDFTQFQRVEDPRAERFSERFRPLGSALSRDPETGRYRADLNGDGTGDLSFGDPDFNFKQLRSNAVLRWEYRPGSTLFLVWSQGRTDATGVGEVDPRHDLGRLLAAPGTHVLLVKLTYWLGA